MEKTLIILRGLPGSGKSTVAKIIQPKDKLICTADDYFMQDGIYKFDPRKLGQAHSACQSKARNAMSIGFDNIVIANTNTTEKEMQVYFDMAKEYDYRVVSLIVENRHGNINIHDVPDNKLELMKQRFDIKL